MLNPQLAIPHCLTVAGKKDLSPLALAECEKAIHNLKKITGDDEVIAWNVIGLIYAYQNQYDNALDYFEKNYEKSGLAEDFLNIVLTLECKGEYLSAINKSLNYLENNLDLEVLNFLTKLILKYPSVTNLGQLNSILEKIEDTEIRKYFLDRLEQNSIHIELLNKVQIPMKSYTLIQNIIDITLNFFYFFKGKDFISEGKISIDNELFGKIRIFNADYEDIVELNALYDTTVQQFIEQGKLTLDEYLDILSKYNFSFVIHTESKEEWEKTCATS